MNEYIKDNLMNDWINEWKKGWMNKWINNLIKEWMNEWMNKGMDEWMNEWKNERMNEWMNEWTTEWIYLELWYCLQVETIVYTDSSILSCSAPSPRLIQE